MKRKELYEYIREEIINELTLTEVDLDPKAGAMKIKKGSPLDNPANILKYTTKNIDVEIIPESELEEMARNAVKITIDNLEKAEIALQIYQNSNVAKLINLIQNSDEGMTQDELKAEIPKYASINYDINALIIAGALKKSSNLTPEMPPEEDEEEENEDEEEENEEEEKEPTDSDEEEDTKAYANIYKPTPAQSKKDDEKIANQKIVSTILGKMKKMKKDSVEYTAKKTALKSFLNNPKNNFTKTEITNNLKSI